MSSIKSHNEYEDVFKHIKMKPVGTTVYKRSSNDPRYICYLPSKGMIVDNIVDCTFSLALKSSQDFVAIEQIASTRDPEPIQDWKLDSAA